MENGMDWLFWAILIVGALAFLYVPQFLARRRQKKRESELAVGDRIMTIGGFVGTLTYIDFDDNIAHVKLADGVEVEMVPGAINGKRQDESPSGETSQSESNAVNSQGAQASRDDASSADDPSKI
jgi:preprotein translocase YajC subunit